MNKIKTGVQKFGFIPSRTHPITYQIGEAQMSSLSPSSAAESAPETLTALSVGDYFVWPNGVDNLDPTICKELIKGNRLLPSLIEKQISILYGSGYQLFTQEIEDSGKIKRHYIQDPEIAAWLDNWRENGLPDDVKTYLNKCIRSYYYSEGIYTKWHFTRGIRAALPGIKPVAGLEHISETRCRFATRKDIRNKHDIENKDFDFVMVGNWASNSTRMEHSVYPRFDYQNPTSKHTPISYSRNPNYGEEVYATNVFFSGIKEWIKGCNATPEYINSFLENALSARHHIIIPNAWMAAKQQAIMDLCDKNATLEAQGQPLKTIELGKGRGWTIEVGTVYSDEILEKYVNLELKKLTEFLSGRGKNQGKVYATRAFTNESGQQETWKIEEVSQKYKEYIDALISYDKRSDMVLLSAKGIDSSISNISSDGIVSKSGADAYYNYVIYLLQQTIPEEIVCADINYAIKLNFPEKYRAGIRLGFYRPNVERQEDTTPSQRLANQTE